MESKVVRNILCQIEDDVYWPRVDRYDFPEYGFSYLAELGVNPNHSIMRKVINNFLKNQLPNRSLPSSYYRMKDRNNIKSNTELCYYALTLRGLINLGYQDDIRIKKAIEFTLSEAR